MREYNTSHDVFQQDMYNMTLKLAHQKQDFIDVSVVIYILIVSCVVSLYPINSTISCIQVWLNGIISTSYIIYIKIKTIENNTCELVSLYVLLFWGILRVSNAVYDSLF